MIEIILMIILARMNGQIAQKKGLKPFTWQLNTVLAWLAGGFIGTAVALQFFKPEDIFIPIKAFKMTLTTLPFAFAGFHLVYYTLKKKPDTTGINPE